MDVFLWLLKIIIGPVVAVVVTLIVSEPLKTRLSPLVARLGSKKEEGLTGTWEAVFYHGPEEAPYVEVIKISALLGNIVGHIEPHEKNHEGLRKVDLQRPIRLRGEVKDNRFFAGIWFHPSRQSHHQGAFQLLINTNNREIRGTWLGYSESKNIIESGRWEWHRMDATYSKVTKNPSASDAA